MKKIIIITLLTLNLMGIVSPISPVYADDRQGSWSVIPNPSDIMERVGEDSADLNNLKALPQGEIQNGADDETKSIFNFYSAATKLVMGIATILVVVGFFIAGVMYVTAQGNEEMHKKAVNIMLYTVAGIIIIAAAYGIIIGIAKLNPF